MNNRTLLILTTMLIISSATHLSLAADSFTDQVAKQPSSAVDSKTENVLFEYSARKILGYSSEARVALDNKQNDVANSYIDDALSELDKIRGAKNFLEMLGIKLGRVRYGENNSYYIPIADDTYAVRTYEKGPFWLANKTTAVSDVELLSVDISINPEKAADHLQAAKSKIAANDNMGASMELKNLLDESIHKTTTVATPLIKLEDNIYLTRVLIRQQNYDGAHYTLNHAKNALKDYEATAATPEHRTSIKNMRKEIDELDNTIKKNNPTLLQKSADMVDKWWKDIKSWVNK